MGRPHQTKLSRPKRRACLAATLLIAATWSAASATAQAAQPAPGSEERPAPTPAERGPGPAPLPIDVIQELIRKIESRTDLDATAKASLIEAYQKTLEHLRDAQQWSARTAQYEQEKQNSTQVIEQIRAELSQSPAEPKIDAPADESVAQLELKQAAANEALAAAQQARTQLTADDLKQQERRTQAPKDLAAARQRLDEVDREIGALPPVDPGSEQALANLRRALARKSAIAAEIHALETEIATFEARSNLLAALRDRAERRVADAQKLAAAWRAAVEARQQIEQKHAAELQRQARAEAAMAHPAVKGLANTKAELTEQAGRLLTLRNAAANELDRVRERQRIINDHFTALMAQIKSAERTGLQEAIGRSLRRQRDALPEPRQILREIRVRQKKIAEAQDMLQTYEEMLRDSADIETKVSQVLSSAEAPIDPAQRDEVADAARRLLEAQREQLQGLKKDSEEYFARLRDIDAVQQETLTTVTAFRQIIDQRVLWIRSGINTPLVHGDLTSLRAASKWLLSPSAWASLARLLGSDFTTSPAAVTLAVIAFLTLVALQGWMRRQLLVVASVVPGSYGERFGHTIAGLLLSGLIAGVWPSLLMLIVWRLVASESVDPFDKAVAMGLFRAGAMLFILEFLRQLCRSGGIGEKHFRWPPAGLKLVRRNLMWLELLALPVVFIVWAMEIQPVEQHRESLGRLAFIVGLLALTVFTYRILRPGGALTGDFIARRRGGWLDRLRYLWFPLFLAMPVTMAALAGAGYYYTALRLEQRLQFMILLVVALLVVSAMLVRWLYLVRRRLAVEQARKRQEAEQAEGRAAPGAVAMSEAAVATEPEVDLWAISDQARSLLQAFTAFAIILGIWLIWADVVPALAALDQVTLWSEPASGDSPAAVTTLKDLLFSVIILVITILAAKNIPGLLEITLLQRLPIRVAARYATTTIARYLIVIVGLIVMFKTIGIGWGKVQWMAAAITVGLGFGLQETIANFVSGLIILFEQPIRVGDTVTVGDISGTVTRIRIRATTIVDWDRKELIIPNKTFVTGQIVNWSLSDPTLRLRIPVGIAYGSDTRLARSILLDAANANPHVLRQPEPLAVMIGFGASALNFELRVFIPNVDYLVAVRHELHDAIDQAFRKHGIEIAFPQQDIHVRTLAAPGEARSSKPGNNEPR